MNNRLRISYNSKPCLCAGRCCGRYLEDGDKIEHMDGRTWHFECFDDGAVEMLEKECGATRGVYGDDFYSRNSEPCVCAGKRCGRYLEDGDEIEHMDGRTWHFECFCNDKVEILEKECGATRGVYGNDD